MTTKIDKAPPDRRPRKVLVALNLQWMEEAKSLRVQRDALSAKLTAITADNQALEKRVEGSRKDFADLKARLLAAELANAEMRGYVTRLQEDDVVREDLVTTGDPNGERQMVPKRKHHTFGAPSQMTAERPRHDFEERISGYRGGDEPRRPRCWVSY